MKNVNHNGRIMKLLAIGAILWVITGFVSFVYWWTNKHSFSASEIWLGLIASLFGPLMWFIGWTIWGDYDVMLLGSRRK